MKKDRQECRQEMPVVAPRGYAVEIKREALKQSFNIPKSSVTTSGDDIDGRKEMWQKYLFIHNI